MRICIVAGSLLENDAIGNDVCHQCLALNTKNISTFVYAEEVAGVWMKPYVIAKGELFDLIDDHDNILIYHHGGRWPAGQEILEKAKCKIFIKYHNVTSSEFFKPYNKFYEKYCSEGMEQTQAIAGLNNVTKFLCDSSFNAQDLLMLNADEAKMEIVPPFHKLDDFKNAKIETGLARNLRDGKVNVLFVGRVVPNKGHKHLIRVISKYVEMYDANIRLNIVGGLDPALDLYINEINNLVGQKGLKDIVRIRGSVSFDELHTYYKYSHIFLLMSAHEGFCLPILEAQFHSLPIVALDGSAVSETMGPNQILFADLNYQNFAVAINVLFHTVEYRRYLAAEGQKNIERFSNKTIEDQFLKTVLN